MSNPGRLLISMVVAGLLGACSDAEGEGDDGTDSDSTDSADSTDSTDSTDDAPTADAGVAEADGSPGAPDGGAATATMTGKVTRSAMPVNGGKGPLFIAVFPVSPIGDPGALPVAQLLFDEVDFAAAGATIDYSLPGIPPRDAPYHVIAFLDDNHTVDTSDPDAAGPDKGDLLSMNGIMAPTVVLADPTSTTLDLDLNFAMPF